MKKGKKIGLGIVVGVLVVLSAVTIWQWGNIKAIYMGLTYNDEKIENKIVESKEKLAKKLENEGIVDKKIIEGFSKEDEEKIAKGELTVEEAVEKLFATETDDEVEPDATEEPKNNSGSDEKNPSENKAIKEDKDNKKEGNNKPKQEDKNKADKSDTDQKKDTSKPVEAKPVDSGKGNEANENKVVEQQKQPENAPANEEGSSNSESKRLIESAVKQMYSLKAGYIQQLAAIESSAKAMYVKGEMTQERKLEIADSLMPQLVDAERACDSQVDSILSDLKSNLSAIGADTSVVQDIRDQYQNEKQLQKSKYISKYM